MSLYRTNLGELPRDLDHDDVVHAPVRELTGLPPVILCGGEANALSVARELSRQGVRVIAIGAEPTCVRYSRRCQWIQLSTDAPEGEQLLQFLLGPDSQSLRGGVLLACSDAALIVLARHRRPLQQHYRLDLANPTAQLAMLDKLKTYEVARAAGVATPKFWSIESHDDVQVIRHELV